MSEYIKKSDAREAVRETCRNLNYITPPVMQLTTAIDNAPSADVEPVRHGHWTIKHPMNMRLDRRTDVMECSECGHQIFRRTGEIVNYCPDCGAKMDGEGREHE